MKRIGLWGGSFNPPTLAHKALAYFAFDKLSLDEMLWLVSPQNPLKDPATLAPLKDRMAMVDLELGTRKDMRPSDIEHQLGSSFTINTVRHFRKQYPEDYLFWLMGTDNWQKFHLWGDDHEKIFDNVSIVIFRRPNFDISDYPASRTFRDLYVPTANELKPYGSWTILDNPESDVAATQVRLAASTGGPKPAHVSEAVWAYIKEKGLYKSQP